MLRASMEAIDVELGTGNVCGSSWCSSGECSWTGWLIPSGEGCSSLAVRGNSVRMLHVRERGWGQPLPNNSQSIR